ncbi:hypothetical protein I7I48_00198 [Histoplasma ohiense]|nr:hypothetical protein I7I48_00198 [Histoplasma ohiense (nom. inval.)]
MEQGLLSSVSIVRAPGENATKTEGIVLFREFSWYRLERTVMPMNLVILGEASGSSEEDSLYILEPNAISSFAPAELNFTGQC